MTAPHRKHIMSLVWTAPPGGTRKERKESIDMKQNHWLIIAAGALVGLAALVLTASRSPTAPKFEVET